MKKLCILVFISLIIKPISARNKITYVTYEFRQLEYAWTTYFAEYSLQDKQLVLKEQPCPGVCKFEEVLDDTRLATIMNDLVQQIGKEIEHDQCLSCKRMRAYLKKKKNAIVPFVPSFLASFNNMFYPAITIVTNKGYVILHPDYTNLDQYIMCYNNKYYEVPIFDCMRVINFIEPEFEGNIIF